MNTDEYAQQAIMENLTEMIVRGALQTLYRNAPAVHGVGIGDIAIEVKLTPFAPHTKLPAPAILTPAAFDSISK